MRFEPNPKGARREAILAAAASFVVAPVHFYCHTQELVEALSSSTRTMDLRWVDALGELG